MYRTTVTLLLSLSILPVGQARADDFCALLARVTNDVPNKFKALRAGPDDTGDYHSSLIFPGAKDCYIANDSDFFSCNWKLGSDEDADEQAQVLAQGISGCFPGGRTIPARTSGSGTSYRYIAESINYTDRANPSSRRVSLRINVEP